MKLGLFRAVFGSVLVAVSVLSARSQTIEIKYEGGWTNLTFGSRGKAVVDVLIQAPNATMKFDLDGLVFGTFDPPLITIPGVVQNGVLTFDVKSVPGFGDIAGSVNILTGATTIDVVNVPLPFIKAVQLTGTINRKIDLQFSVDFNEPSSPTNPARGVIVAEALAPLRITSVALVGGKLLVSWSGGKPPYQLQTSSDLNGWQNAGAPITGMTGEVVPPIADRAFIRVAGQ